MRFSSYALPALAAHLAAALPRPQDIDLDMVLAAPDPTYSQDIGATAQTITVDPQALIASATAAVSSVSVAVSDVLSQTAVVNSKRAAASPTTCASQPAGASSAPTYAADVDNVSNFRANTYYSSVAAAAPTPTGYTQSFQAQTASNNAFGYMGFDTFDDYDVNTCATRCNVKYGCVSFNIYFERDPSVNPDDSSCSDPRSVTMIKCVYWGGQVTQENAQNTGQPRGKFIVAIAGSNGYVSTQISTPAGYQIGVPYGKFAINAPYDAQGYNTVSEQDWLSKTPADSRQYMGAKIFTGTWDVSQCSNYCDAQTKYNLATAPKDGTPAKVCKFFNTYLLQAKLANGTIVPQGQYCSLYTEAWPIKYAVNGGQWRGQDQYTVDYSFGYAKTASSSDVDPTLGDANGAKYQAVADIKWSSLQPFCSSFLSYSTPLVTVATTTFVTPVATSTVYSISTVAAMRKRAGGASPTAGLTTDASAGIAVLIDDKNTTWYLPQSQGNVNAPIQKRTASLAIPGGLSKYPTTVIRSACEMQATPVTATSTITSAVTLTTATSTTVTSIISYTTAAAHPKPKADNLIINAPGSTGSGKPMDYVNYGLPDSAIGAFNIDPTKPVVHVGFYIDSSTGYVMDGTYGLIMAAYSMDAASRNKYAAMVYWKSPSAMASSNYDPLVCTQTAPSNFLHCSITSSGTTTPLQFFAMDYSAASDLFVAGNGLTLQYGQYAATVSLYN
ncbi:hypothetical protein E4T38_00598 [Aureobasidium subglaciale]|nr:hypothetical protein E4T38_00598 [Aureobasidium subglaciale]KAI5231560.1 hypothetical protein E4T40_00304 [Aureobasidium subglaciale]KAI5234299.1 hypothetical protein E4T41_00597 [Aureobasidium subglaciale]KAI5267951.1 hypothetical protein E4T46_00597 [Aureobasidium subglaciale]